MEVILTKEKHKKLVEDIFTMRVKADKLTEGLGNLGFTSIDGELANVLYFSFLQEALIFLRFLSF